MVTAVFPAAQGLRCCETKVPFPEPVLFVFFFFFLRKGSLALRASLVAQW